MDNNHKTIFLVVQQGYSIRYILRTDIFRTLVKSGMRIVILSPNGNDDDFKKQFDDKNVIVEKFENEKCETYLNKSRIQRVMRTVRFYTLNGRYNTQTADNYFMAFKKRAIITRKPRLWKVSLIRKVSNLFRKSRRLRKIIVAVEDFLFTPDFHEHLFKKYKPLMTVVTSLGNLDFDRYIMREARKNKSLITSVILGMDNSSTKGYSGSHTDFVVSWTENMKQELIELHDIDCKKIFVGGVAHFDYYFNDGYVWDREEFCKRKKLDPDRKIIFFGTKSPNTCPWTDEIVKFIAEAIEENYFGVQCQLLVRLHPINWRRQNGKLVFEHILDRYENIRNRFRYVVFCDPKFESKGISYDLQDEEFYVLKSILTHSDVMINMFSTLNIEASIFDLPAINICYKGKNRDPKNPLHDPMFDYNESHNQRIIQTGGVRTVISEKELLNSIKEYLEHPEMERAEREKIKLSECGPFQGYAGATIGRYLVNLVNE